MKKNILTIIIMAVTLINSVLLAVLVLVIVPTSNKTNNLVSKVAEIVNLELEAPDAADANVAVSDISIHEIPDKLTINLKKSDGTPHYAVVNVSLSVNKKNKDTATLEPLIDTNNNEIKEIVTEEFSKYTMDEVASNKDIIKDQVLTRLQDYFHSNFIISVSFGNLIMN